MRVILPKMSRNLAFYITYCNCETVWEEIKSCNRRWQLQLFNSSFLLNIEEAQSGIHSACNQQHFVDLTERERSARVVVSWGELNSSLLFMNVPDSEVSISISFSKKIVLERGKLKHIDWLIMSRNYRFRLRRDRSQNGLSFSLEEQNTPAIAPTHN